jgi:hypothetical protein
MAVSTCIKCDGHSFELARFTPIGESKKLTIVQCSQCGTPIGAMDPAIGPQIEALKSQIAAIDERLNRIAKALQELTVRRPQKEAFIRPFHCAQRARIKIKLNPFQSDEAKLTDWLDERS